MLYRGMDRAQLDAAYDNLAAVTASAKLLADWAARSARFRERHRGHLGLAMANSRVKGSTCSLLVTPRRRPSLTSTAAIGK